MGYLGYKPADKPLTSADITDSIITSAKIADGTIVNADINASAAIASTKLSGSFGKVLQVVTATDETVRNVTSTSYVTGSNTLSVTITPSSTSSKIFIIMSTNAMAPSDTYAGDITIYRGATNLATNQFARLVESGTYGGSAVCITVLDSPSTTSATTYQVYVKIESGGNRIIFNEGSSKGSITAFEIGA
jgi:hypothetical protein